MITEEQIKNLKPGDPIVIRTTFMRVDGDGDIRFKAQSNNGNCYELFISTDYVSLSTDSQSSIVNKYDPCRLFKKGDRAQVVERHGRTMTCLPAGRIKVGDIVTVAENESGDVFINVITEDGHKMMVPWFMMELITPVEELEPYFMYESKEEESFDIMKRVGKLYLTRNCIYYKSDINDLAELTREQAKAAAEAERDRLNDEWRKEDMQ